MTDVCLVLMPYGGIERPSLALGLLKASLKQSRIKSEVLYSNLWFASKIGIHTYKELADDYTEDLLPEWTFSGAAFPEFKPNHSKYFSTIANKKANIIKQFWGLREQATLFIEQVAQSILERHPRIVSCSSTHYQHCASLALLRRIRELEPKIVTIMGGANCEGLMGLTTHQAFPWIDFVCSGEGDELFAKLCRKLLDRGRDLAPQDLPYGVIGPCYRDRGLIASEAPRASVPNLDRIPIPDFDDYFEQLRHYPKIAPYINPGLFVETSRGCWWGQRQHCTFCGLNGQGMSYRSKSPERVVQEFTWLSQRYGLRKFFVVDRILDHRYINTVLPMFAALDEPYTIFFETKANLNRQQVQQLAEAGVYWIQPGIESMHDQALKLMDKGSTALTNVQLLKWGREFGIQVLWNFLVGIPGEFRQWYSEILEWLPLIVHLQPPTGIRSIRYDRFSPYHERPQDYGLTLLPLKAYSYIYPLVPEMIGDLAYYFEDLNNGDNGQSKYAENKGNISEHQELEKWVSQWQRLFKSEQSPILQIIDDDGKQLRIVDSRPCTTIEELRLKGLAYQVYRACDRALTDRELVRVLCGKYRLDVSWDDIQPVVEELRSRKILLALNGRFLSLAVRGDMPPLMDDTGQPGGYTDIQGYLYDVRKHLWSLFKNKLST